MHDIVAGFLRFQHESFPARVEPGELFVIRNAGSIIPPYALEPGGVNIKKVEDPEGGSRAVITLDGKFLPVKSATK